VIAFEGQTDSHLPHDTHFDLLILILNNEILEIREKIAPEGQSA